MELHKQYRWGLTVLLVLLVGVGGYLLWRPAPAPPAPPAALVVYTPTPLPTPLPPPSPTPAPIVVYVSGAVVRPGVYALPAGARVNDAVGAAGGALPEADLVQINLARRVYDEEQVHIPRRGEPTRPPATRQPPPPPSAQGAATGGSPPVNINTATLAELDALPGIGPGYAQKIIEYRESHGPFQTIEEIQNVAGIGPATFARIRDLITVGP